MINWTKHSIPMKTTSNICLNFLLSLSLYVPSYLWTAPCRQQDRCGSWQGPVSLSIKRRADNLQECFPHKNIIWTHSLSWEGPHFWEQIKYIKGLANSHCSAPSCLWQECHRKVKWWLEESPVCAPKYYKCINTLFSQYFNTELQFGSCFPKSVDIILPFGVKHLLSGLLNLFFLKPQQVPLNAIFQDSENK